MVFPARRDKVFNVAALNLSVGSQRNAQALKNFNHELLLPGNKLLPHSQACSLEICKWPNSGLALLHTVTVLAKGAAVKNELFFRNDTIIVFSSQLRTSPFFLCFSVVRPTQIFVFSKKKKEVT